MNQCTKCDGSGLKAGVRSYCGCMNYRDSMALTPVYLTRAEAEAILAQNHPCNTIASKIQRAFKIPPPAFQESEL